MTRRVDAPASASVSGEIVARPDQGDRLPADSGALGPAAPGRIGAFVVRGRLADGPMGTRWIAHDPAHDRDVAITLLRREQTDAAAHRRIANEAKQLGALDHPNVARIFDVGEHRGSTFVATERVDGATLRAWQSQGPPPWPAIVAMYRQAGSGLAAAHTIGLVHRDFGPDHTVVDADGRARVFDFGLAWRGEGLTATDLHLDTLLPASVHDVLGAPLTHGGAVTGTPGYMAPEQLLGEGSDARSDQFAFCVALWEALHGERPFAGTTRAQLLAAVTRGKIRAAPSGTSVPEWIREVLARGLAVVPSERFPSMDGLLAALDVTAVRRRRIAWIVAAAVAVMMASGAWWALG